MNALDKIKNNRVETLTIPVNSTETVDIKVQKPQLLKMMKNGDIPNPLIGLAAELLGFKAPDKIEGNEEENIQKVINTYTEMLELYAYACMVEPTFEEAKGYLTDEQLLEIYNYAIQEFDDISNFR